MLTYLVVYHQVVESDDESPPAAALSEPGFHWDDNNDRNKDEDQDSGVEEDEQPADKTSNKTVNLKDDIYLTAKEHDSSWQTAPQTTTEWERLMVSHPHSSEVSFFLIEKVSQHPFLEKYISCTFMCNVRRN